MQANEKEPTETSLMADIQAGGNRREVAWQYITRYWGVSVIPTTIQRTSCNDWQAREAFSMASVGVDKRVRNAADIGFLQKATLKTYLTQAAIFAAFAIVRKQPQTEELSAVERLAADDAEQKLRSDFCSDLMDKTLDRLGPRCKKILTLFGNGFNMEEIGIEMRFENADVARREKYKCQERFKDLLRDNPGAKQQLQENCYA